LKAGLLEYWNIGSGGVATRTLALSNLHHSIIPSFHHPNSSCDAADLVSLCTDSHQSNGRENRGTINRRQGARSGKMGRYPIFNTQPACALRTFCSGVGRPQGESLEALDRASVDVGQLRKQAVGALLTAACNQGISPDSKTEFLEYVNAAAKTTIGGMNLKSEVARRKTALLG
jgi:hypothetical protein